MGKISNEGISSHFESLPFGAKDCFIVEVAQMIGKSTSTVRNKIKNGSWTKLEYEVVKTLLK